MKNGQCWKKNFFPNCSAQNTGRGRLQQDKNMGSLCDLSNQDNKLSEITTTIKKMKRTKTANFCYSSFSASALETFQPDNSLLCGGCPMHCKRCFTASLASTHQMLVSTPQVVTTKTTSRLLINISVSACVYILTTH